MAKLNEVIKLGRKRKGYTQADLSEQIGVSKVTIVAWEKGYSAPDGEKLLVLIKKLDLYDDLFPQRKSRDEEIDKIWQAIEELRAKSN